jgi:hypothetical protein
MRATSILLWLAAVLAVAPAAVCAHEHSDAIPTDAQLGLVSFDISCKPGARKEFNRGIALLHSFWHDEALRAFEQVASDDPDCAMA